MSEPCQHGTNPIYRCPVNAEHDEVSLSDEAGNCEVCGEELEAI